MPGRLREWDDVLAHVGAREPIDGGVRLQFGPGPEIDELARLVGSEQACCGFFAFSITVDSQGLGLEVRAPAGAQAVLMSLFGTAPRAQAVGGDPPGTVSPNGRGASPG